MKYLTHPIVVIDVETTGFSYTDEVIEIGAVFVDEFGRIIDLNGLDFSFCLELEHV